MNLNAQQWLMIAVVVAFFVALYLWSRHQGRQLGKHVSPPRSG